jgi:hypothetical protein
MINDTDAEDLSNDCEYGIEVEEEIDEEFVRWEEEEHQRQSKWQQDKGAQAFWGLLEMGRDTLPREVISEILTGPAESPQKPASADEIADMQEELRKVALDPDLNFAAGGRAYLYTASMHVSKPVEFRLLVDVPEAATNGPVECKQSHCALCGALIPPNQDCPCGLTEDQIYLEAQPFTCFHCGNTVPPSQECGCDPKEARWRRASVHCCLLCGGTIPPNQEHFCPKGGDK